MAFPDPPDTPPRLVVLDIDGTLVNGGFRRPVDPAALDALMAARGRAQAQGGEVHVALITGRTAPDTLPVARAVGADAYACELGGLLVAGGEGDGDGAAMEAFTFPWDGADDPADAVRASGLLDRVLAAHPGLRVDEFGHRCSVPLSGRLPASRVPGVRALVEGSDARFTALDNSVPDRLTILHVGPRGLGKAAGVRALRERFDVPADATVLFGDSPEDARCLDEVRTVYLVAPGGADGVGLGNVLRPPRPGGEGVAWGLGREFGLGEGPGAGRTGRAVEDDEAAAPAQP